MIGANRVRAMLRRACDDAGSINQWAIAHKITPTQVQFCLSGRFPPQPKILKALGLERVVKYRSASK